jgi:signal transduction histidine kinase
MQHSQTPNDMLVANKEIGELKTELEKMVEERTLQLKEQQARLQASINSLNVGYIMTDTNGEIVSSNSAARYMLSRIVPDKTMQFEKEIKIHDLQSLLGTSLDLHSLIQKTIYDKRPATNIEIPFGTLFLKFLYNPNTAA